MTASYDYQPNSSRGYSPVDPRKLGFRAYHQSKYPPRNQDYGGENRPGVPQEDYVYNSNDYPGLQSNQISNATNRIYASNNSQGFF